MGQKGLKKIHGVQYSCDDDDDEIAYFTCAEKLELVLSTAPKHEITPTKTVKTENGPISRVSQSEVLG